MNASSAAVMLAERIDALLPQTQCRQCGYSGCRPYADAVAAGNADINRCPPGGTEVLADLARLFDRVPPPLDTSCGVTQPPAVARIDETWCIGCTLCIQACPVDAIVGAAKVMHTVIAADCTGCALCIPPCPVDCIAMVPVTRASERSERVARADYWRDLYRARQNRQARTAAKPPLDIAQTPGSPARKQAAIARALARAQQRIEKNII